MRKFIITMMAVALCALTPNAKATDFTLSAEVVGAFDLGFTPIALPNINTNPGFAAVYQVDFSVTTENVSAGELGFANVAYSIGLNNLTDAAGGWQPTSETVDTNGAAPGGTASLFATNLDAGTPGDLVGILTSIAGGLTTSSPTDDRILVGQAPNGTRFTGSIFVQWDGLTAADLSTTSVAFSANSDTGLFLQSAPGAPLSIQFGGTAGPNVAPVADLLGPIEVNIVNGDPLNIVLDASGSTDSDGPNPLTYEWDLNNDGTFEISPSTNSTLAIADVTTTFGGFGDYLVSVRVSDGTDFDIASSTVSLIPEPGSIALASMGLIGLLVRRRRHTS